MIPSRFVAILMGAVIAWTAWPARVSAEIPELDHRLDPVTRDAVSAVVTDAEKEGLPTRPLVAKALEGASKGADGERIVKAVRAYAEALRRARRAIGAESIEAEIVAAAGAVQAGVPVDTLAHLRSARPHDSLVVPLVVLSDMVARHVPVDVASVAVLEPARAGARDADLSSIRERVEKDIRAGVAPAAAAQFRSKAWLSTRARPESPQDKPKPTLPSQRKTGP
jgi:hypothetical protein